MVQMFLRLQEARRRAGQSDGTWLAGLVMGLILLLLPARPGGAQPILVSSCTSGVHIMTTCGTPATRGFLINNLGDQTLVLGSLSFIGPNAGDFTAMANATSLPPQGPIAGITVTFTPHGTADSLAFLVVTSNDPASPFILPVQGHIWNTTSAVSLSPSLLTFTASAVGSPSGSQSLTITNTSTTSSTSIGSVGVSGPNAGDFSFSPALSTLSGITLGPGASQSVSVTFTPSSHGSASATVTAGLSQTSGTGCQASASLVGNLAEATCGCSVSPMSHDFGTAAGSQTFAIMNTGSSPLTINTISLSGASNFQVTGQPTGGTMIQPNQSAAVTVGFTPPASDNVTSTLTVNPGTNCACTASLRGSGSGTGNSGGPECSLMPTMKQFGDVAGSQVFTLTNMGGSTLTISSVALSGDASFTKSGDTGETTLAPHQSRSITISFTPPAIGTASGALTINSGEGGVCSATLSGSAPPPGPQCSLSPTMKDFGMTAGSQVFTLTNTGGSTLTINSVTLGSSPNFSKSSDTGETTLAPHQSRTITVSFTPPTSGSVTDTLTIDSGTGGVCTATMSGEAPCAPLSITCPADLRVCAPEGQCAASGVTITPTITPNAAGTSVTCVRSDGQSLAAPYPFGTTIVTCTARDACGDVATCSQRVTVVPGGQTEVHMSVAGGSDQVTINVGDCISLQMLMTVAGCSLVQDVTGTTVFSTDPARGTFHGNVFCATAAEANHEFPIYGKYFNPCSGTFVTATVSVTVRRNDGKQ